MTQPQVLLGFGAIRAVGSIRRLRASRGSLLGRRALMDRFRLWAAAQVMSVQRKHTHKKRGKPPCPLWTLGQLATSQPTSAVPPLPYSRGARGHNRWLPRPRPSPWRPSAAPLGAYLVLPVVLGSYPSPHSLLLLAPFFSSTRQAEATSPWPSPTSRPSSSPPPRTAPGAPTTSYTSTTSASSGSSPVCGLDRPRLLPRAPPMIFFGPLCSTATKPPRATVRAAR